MGSIRDALRAIRARFFIEIQESEESLQTQEL